MALDDSSRLLSVLRLAALLACPDLSVETHTAFGALLPFGTQSALSEQIQPGCGALDLPQLSQVSLTIHYICPSTRTCTRSSACIRQSCSQLGPGHLTTLDAEIVFDAPCPSLSTSAACLRTRIKAGGPDCPHASPMVSPQFSTEPYGGAQHPASAALCL
ncbi:hypothetical protein B0H14DRAFT_3468303 [Mycena olivaceomarginata]|nr:hypothetical protein B0H14DRAFT_3468303 [Mycena olivaceomarginata]